MHALVCVSGPWTVLSAFAEIAFLGTYHMDFPQQKLDGRLESFTIYNLSVAELLGISFGV